MAIYYIPGPGNTPGYVKTGTLIVDGSGYITGKFQTATGAQFDATIDIAKRVDMATGFDACGGIVCATALTVCGVAQ